MTLLGLADSSGPAGTAPLAERVLPDVGGPDDEVSDSCHSGPVSRSASRATPDSDQQPTETSEESDPDDLSELSDTYPEMVRVAEQNEAQTELSDDIRLTPAQDSSDDTVTVATTAAMANPEAQDGSAKTLTW